MSAVDRGLAGLRSLMALQASSRALTFVLNVFVVKRLSPEVYGIATVQQQLYLATVFSFSRESFRLALVRGDGGRAAVNASWLVLPLGVVAALVALAASSVATDGAMQLCAVGAIAELVSEPFFLVVQHRLEYGLRLRVEGLAVLLKCLVTFLLVVVVDTAWPLHAYAVAQIAYGLALTVGFAWTFGRRGELAAVLPDGSMGASERGVVQRVAQFFFLSMEKLVLTDGEKMVLAMFGVADAQGVYGLVSNLGSLVARLVFQPVEESARATFAKLVEADDDASLALWVRRVVKAMAIAGLVFVSFGPPFAFDLLDILYGARWSATAAPAILGAYCFYVLFMGLNGVTEAFFHASATPYELRINGAFLVVCSAVYVGAAIVALNTVGVVGLVWANSLNMSLRVAHHVYHIRRRLPDVPLLGLLPSAGVLASFAIVGALLPAAIAALGLSRWARIGLGAVALVAVGLATAALDEDAGALAVAAASRVRRTKKKDE